MKGFTVCTVDPTHYQGCVAGIWTAQCQTCRAPMKYEEVCGHGYAVGQCANTECHQQGDSRD